MSFTITLSCSSDDGSKMERNIKGIDKNDLAAKVAAMIQALDALYYQHFDLRIQSNDKG